MFTVLVDYDNVRELYRQRGLVFVVELVVRSLGYGVLNGVDRLRMRLYGGWFEENRISRRAQLLATQIYSSFPRRVSVTDQTGAIAAPLVNVEFARSLECDPSNVLTHTYRPRAGIGSVKGADLPYRGCADAANCPLGCIYAFLTTENCPTLGCTVTIGDVFLRQEQKLVDAMMVSDLIHLSLRQKYPLIVVSSDDDLWPGIHSALVHGAVVHHVHSISGRVTPPHYSSLIAGQYFQYSF